jgi:hypothetical protein
VVWNMANMAEIFSPIVVGMILWWSNLTKSIIFQGVSTWNHPREKTEWFVIAMSVDICLIGATSRSWNLGLGKLQLIVWMKLDLQKRPKMS